MSNPDIPDREEADILAAEYVLGTLPLQARTAAETRIRRDAHFALAVEKWQERLAPLNESYDEAPAPDLMPKIEARLFGTPAKKQSFWKSWIIGAGVAASLGLAVLVFLPPSAPAPFLPLTSLTAAGSDLRYDATLRGDELRIAHITGAGPDADHAHELWLIVGDAAPVSLGVLDSAEKILAAKGLNSGMVLAISLEPAGGSPTGAPTGPVLVTGIIEKS